MSIKLCVHAGAAKFEAKILNPDYHSIDFLSSSLDKNWLTQESGNLTLQI